MADLIDYLKWRQDVPFSVSEFNPADNLVLCQISYLHFDGLIPTDFKEGISIEELYKKFISSPDRESRSKAGALISDKTDDLFYLVGESARFKDMTVRGYINKIDEENEEQFCALCYTYNAGIGKKENYIIFRGTDDNIVGWKEDFNLGFMETVPSQRDALSYLINAAKNLSGPITLCGHSKGGNLSIYSATYAGEKIQKRIRAIYNNDGPGFSKDFFTQESYLAIKDKEKSFVPEMSIVGMLFSHSDTFKTVKNDAKGIAQHDPFTWHLCRDGFVEIPSTNEQSKFIDETINKWFSELSAEQKKQFVETTFSILRSGNASTNTELAENWGESLMQMLKAMTKIDAKTRDAVGKTLQLLFKNAWENYFKPKGKE